MSTLNAMTLAKAKWLNMKLVELRNLQLLLYFVSEFMCAIDFKFLERNPEFGQKLVLASQTCKKVGNWNG